MKTNSKVTLIEQSRITSWIIIYILKNANMDSQLASLCPPI